MVISVDREFIEPIDGADILSFSNINDNKTIDKISKLLNESKVNSVLSDMVKLNKIKKID